MESLALVPVSRDLVTWLLRCVHGIAKLHARAESHDAADNMSAEAFSPAILRVRERFPLGRTRRNQPPFLPTRSKAVVDSSKPLVLVGEREHRLYLLDPQKIDYIESAGNYVKYRIANDEYIARESVKHLDRILCNVGFVRIERSLLLNIRAILYVQPIGHGTFAFTLMSGARLRSGPAYRDTILDVLPLRRRAKESAGS
jgi:DNA-binding LytR/AlgR family response regulator